MFEGMDVPAASAGAPMHPCSAPPASAPARVQEPNRLQVELRASDLDSLLPADHRARLVWRYVEQQDLNVLFDAIRARGSAPGRRAIDPRILFSLWLYATLDGVGSGREVARLSQSHDAYRWICGGVSVNYHALNDFRVGNEALMDRLLSHNVAALAAVGVIRLVRVAQDGMRVRASAGAASFRRKGTLKEHHAKATEMVHSLKEQARENPGQAERRAQAARLRAAELREQQLAAALARLPELEAIKQRNGQPIDKARASTTDADASNMKMADGGWRPAYNVQLATDCASQVIVGVDTVTAGSDMAQLAPMVQQVHQRVGKAAEQWLVDGGLPAHGQLDAVADKTEVYAPVPQARAPKGKSQGQDDEQQPPAPGSQFQPKAGDSTAVAQWRQRMSTDEAREIYKDRAATAECVNAQARNRGLLRMPVRGLAKVKCIAWWYALAHNLMRTVALAPQLIGWGTGACAGAAALT
ncbi:IS1182-like element ISVei6 family transposase [Verminephrobacter eiseniae]|uniref:IS1182-like element ISVei6 family transposase n=1 Tax=Verminephrobacter eiseniae TaxID=364317 RepID=UPI0022387DFD|nr:IS1182-like element ISVei6 family transposase [Verminephrobacter eiseniae]MCW5260658.1 IS1182-like element ISVei6 family transposase [Verminephrobacter eiseniae]